MWAGLVVVWVDHPLLGAWRSRPLGKESISWAGDLSFLM